MRPKLLGLLILLVISGVLAGFYFWPGPTPISPLVNYTPDLSKKLEGRPRGSLILDFSSATKSTITSPRYLSFNLDTGRVYHASGAAEKMSPASFTKLLTSQVALDIGRADQLLSATAFSTTKEPTILGIKIGEQFLLSELLRASIATSGNDAATAMAESLATQNGLSLSDFIDLMNKKAKYLSMDESHFANPDGLDDPDQYTTLTDMAKLVTNIHSNYPEIIEAGHSDRHDISKSDFHGFYYLPNWNGLLGVYPGVFGLKIAYTEKAGYGTIVLAQRSGKRIVVILSGAGKLLTRDLEASILLNKAFEKEGVKSVDITENDLKKHYQVWNDLATKIRRELELLKQ